MLRTDKCKKYMSKELDAAYALVQLSQASRAQELKQALDAAEGIASMHYSIAVRDLELRLAQKFLELTSQDVAQFEELMSLPLWQRVRFLK